MTDRKNWKTRLVVRVQSETLGEFIIAPIESITPRIDTPHDVIDSIEDTNLGYIRRPPRFAFDLSALAIGDVVQKLTKLQLAGDEFAIQIQVAEEGTEDWSFYEDGLVMENCIITGGGPSNVVQDGAARATFNGLCLAVQESGVTYSRYGG